VAFRFQKASCVAVGTFNMYILHPQWLAKYEIIEPGTEVGIETNLTQPGFRFRLPDRKATWNVTPNRLVIESPDPGFGCGDTIARILKILPETPLFALGNNFHYQAELSERDNLSASIRDFPETDPLTEEQSVLQRTFHAGVRRSERETINLQVALKEEGIELACNVHHELSDRENASEAAVAAAERFFEDRAEVEALAQHFFGATIEHD